MKIPNARKHIVVWLGLMLFLVPVLVLALQEENGEVSQILQDARDKAAVLSRDADEMEALTRSDVSWQSHASMLDTMKDDVNALSQDVQKLTAERDKALPGNGKQ